MAIYILLTFKIIRLGTSVSASFGAKGSDTLVEQDQLCDEDEGRTDKETEAEQSSPLQCFPFQAIQGCSS